MGSGEQIRGFLGRKRVAVVGVSRDPHHFSRSIFRAFAQRGYDVVPVHPSAEEMEGRRCFARPQDIQPPVDAALVMTPPERSEQVVHDCVEAGVQRVWMYRASPEALQYCQAKAIGVIAGECPLMFLNGTGWFHRAHGLVRKIKGTYPK